MTIPPQHNPSSDPSDVDELPVLEERVRSSVHERLGNRTCEWCGEWMAYEGRGRPPRYCSDAHRQRAYEVRTAQARQEHDAAAGKLRTEPVREVVERVETVTKTVVRQGPVKVLKVPGRRASGQPYTLPETPMEWFQALQYLAGDVTSKATWLTPQWRRALADACDEVAALLRAGDPGTQAEPETPRWARRPQPKSRKKKRR